MSELLLTPEHRYAKIIENRRREDGSELSILNLGPTHPATHGIFQNILLMDGERILDAEPTIGYIHRAFEKIAENWPFYQITPLTDRMNYCSSPINNMAWWMTLEKLLDIEVPKRAQYLRQKFQSPYQQYSSVSPAHHLFSSSAFVLLRLLPLK